MALSNQKKIALCTLTLYWPMLFVLTHIPIPRVIRQADVSDKSLHFLTYLVLTFLLLSVLSDDRKVNWRRAALWLVLFLIVAYGILDELLQSYVAGRSRDVHDFFMDLAGALAGLIICSFLTFWAAGLVVAAIFIFGITNVTPADLADLFPKISAVFHFFAYAILTVLWIQCVRLFCPVKASQAKSLILALIGPSGFLIAVILFSVVSGKDFIPFEIILSFGAIVAVAIGFHVRCSAECTTRQ